MKYNETLNIKHILTECAEINNKASILFIADSNTVNIAKKFMNEVKKLNPDCHIMYEKIETLERHGQEPPVTIANLMLEADITMSLSTYSLAHTKARINALNVGKYFLSMPLYTNELLSSEALSVDYKKQFPLVEYVASKFTHGSAVHITSNKGTDLNLNIEGRIGNICPGFVSEKYYLGSPPDIEANVSPVEVNSSGVIVIDGSVTCPQVGLLSEDVIFEINKGCIVSIVSENPKLKFTLESIFLEGNPKKRILAELGVGLNPLAKLTGCMLTDEGAMGTIHFGFGSNSTVGGLNDVDFHLDCVINKPNITIDHQLFMLKGEIVSG